MITSQCVVTSLLFNRTSRCARVVTHGIWTSFPHTAGYSLWNLILSVERTISIKIIKFYIRGIAFLKLGRVGNIINAFNITILRSPWGNSSKLLTKLSSLSSRLTPINTYETINRPGQYVLIIKRFLTVTSGRDIQT